MSIGVRELKSNLSEYLRRAARGEEVIVTDHNRPIARLIAYSTQSDIDTGIEEGWIEAPRRTSLGAASPVRSARSTLEVLDEDRG
jgi:prevent-host-death family protein